MDSKFVNTQILNVVVVVCLEDKSEMINLGRGVGLMMNPFHFRSLSLFNYSVSFTLFLGRTS